MAYVQENKAGFESAKASVASNFLGTMANTLSQQAINHVANQIEERKANEASDLYNSMMKDSRIEVEQIKNTHSPDKWGATIDEVGAKYLATIDASDLSESYKRKVKSQFKQSFNSISTDAQVVGVNKLSELNLAATQQDITKIINSEDEESILNGFGGTLVEVPEGFTVEEFKVSRGLQNDEMRNNRNTKRTFVDNATSGDMSFNIEASNEPEEPAFKEVFIPKGASTFDRKVAAARFRYERMYPENQRLVDLEVERFKETLRLPQAEQDALLILDANLSGEDPMKWSLSNVMTDINQMVENAEYGGRPLTLAEKQALAKTVEQGYLEMDGRMSRITSEIVTSDITPAISELRQKVVEDENYRPSAEEIKAIYDEAIKKGASMKYMNDQYWTDMLMATSFDAESRQERFKALYKAGASDTAHTMHDEYENIMETLSDTTQMKLINEVQLYDQFNVQQATTTAEGFGFSTDTDIFQGVRGRVEAGEWDTEAEMRKALESEGLLKYMTSGSYEMLETRQADYLSGVQAVERSNIEAFEDEFYGHINNKSFGADGMDLQALYSKYDIPPKHQNAYNKIAENETLQELNNDIIGLYNEGALNEESMQESFENLGLDINDYEEIRAMFQERIDNKRLDDFSNVIASHSRAGDLTGEVVLNEAERLGLDPEKNAVAIQNAEEVANNESLQAGLGEASQAMIDGTLDLATLDNIRETNNLSDNEFSKHFVGLYEEAERVSKESLTNDVYGLIDAKKFDDASFEEVWENSGLSKEENEKLYKDLKSVVGNEAAQKAIDKLYMKNKDGRLVNSDVDEVLEEFDINKEEFASVFSQFRTEAYNNSRQDFDSVMWEALNDGMLNEELVMEKLETFGLDKTKDSDLVYKWVTRSKDARIGVAREQLNWSEANNQLTDAEITRYAIANGMFGEDGTVKPEYAEFLNGWYDRAEVLRSEVEADQDTYLRNSAMGFGTKKNENLERQLLGQVSAYETGEGDYTLEDLYTNLRRNRGKLTEDQYRAVEQSIAVAQQSKYSAEGSVFSNSVLNKFLRNKESMMPGDARALMEEAGLDPMDPRYAEHLATMENQELQNQHNANVGQYADMQTYIALVDQGFGYDDIKKMGYWTPEKTNSQWEQEKNGEAYTPYKYAQQNISTYGDLLIQSEKGAIDKQITQSAKDVRNRFVRELKGKNVSTVSVVNKLEVAKFFSTQESFIKLVKANQKELSPEDYKTYLAMDLSNYENPTNEADTALKNALESFRDFAKSELSLSDEDGNKLSAFAVGNQLDQFSAYFMQRYKEEKTALNRELTQDELNQFKKDVYNEVFDHSLAMTGDQYIEFMTTPMGYADAVKLVGRTKDESGDLLYRRQEGGIPLYDPAWMDVFMGDPKEGSMASWEGNGQFGQLITGYRNGTIDDRELGFQIMDKMAREMLSVEGLPEFGSDGYEKEFEKFFDNLPIATARSLMDASADIKALIYVTEDIQSALGSDVMASMMEGGDTPKPVTMNGMLGVDIGGKEVFAVLGPDGQVASYEVPGKDGKLQTFSVPQKEIERKRASVGEVITQSIDGMSQTLGLQPIQFNGEDYKNLSEIDIKEMVFSRYKDLLQGVVDSIESNESVQKQLGVLLSMENKRITDTARLLGHDAQTYGSFEIKVNEEVLRAYTDDGITQLDFNNPGQYFTYEFKRSN